MKRYSDKAMIYMASNILGSFMEIILGMLLVRYLTKFEYGTLRQIMLLTVLTSTTIAIGLPQSLSYFLPRAKTAEVKKQYALQSLVLLSLFGLAVTGIIYIFRLEIGHWFNNPDLQQYAWIFSLYFMFIVPNKLTQSTLIAEGRINFASILNMGTSFANLLFVTVPLMMHAQLQSILLSMLTVYVIQFGIVILIISRMDGGFPKIFEWARIREQVKYSYPLAGSVIVGAMRRYIDQFIVATFYNPVAYAVYSRGAFELPFVALLPQTLSNLMIPRIAEYHITGNEKSIYYLWNESMRKTALLLYPLFVYSTIYAEELITILFTSEYLESVAVFRIYLVLLPVRIIAYRTVLQAVGETKSVLAAVNLSLLISIALGIGLEKLIGLQGPAWAIVCGELLSSGYMFWKTKTFLNVSVGMLLPWRNLFQIFSVSLVAGAIVFPLIYLALSAAPKLCVSAVAYGTTYIFIMKKMKYFTESDWALLQRWTTLKALRG